MQNKVGGHCCHSCIAVMRRERMNFIALAAIFTDADTGCVLCYSCPHC